MDINAFFKITYGLYIVSSRDGDKLNGHVSNTCFQITADPPRFAVASHKDNLTSDYIRKSGSFSVSILQQDVDMEFLGPWGFKSGREIDKFSDCSYIYGKTGCPILMDHTIAWIECRVTESIDTGTHILFIGEVIDAGVVQDDRVPLTYAYYRSEIKGLSPQNSPTFVAKIDQQPETDTAPTEKAVGADMSKYKCTICGYMYNPAEGDPTKAIPPGTAFGDLPDEWLCPICGVGKKEFVKVG